MNDTTFPQVILVDRDDNEIGIAEKLEAHRQGLLHRAFSVFVYRRAANGLEFLLQQRNANKYHSGGLWTNTCCSHPQPGITLLESVKNSLFHETGVTAPLTEIGTFIYRAEFSNGMIEHELDHVFIGKYNGLDNDLKPHPDEIAALKWLTIDEIDHLLTTTPEQFTAWFVPAFDLLKTHLKTFESSL